MRCARSLLAIAAGIIALLLTAITLMPFIAALPWSFDYRIRQNPPPPATAHEIWKAIRATFIPYYGGASWHTPTSEWDFGLARVGSVILALALIAVVPTAGAAATRDSSPSSASSPSSPAGKRRRSIRFLRLLPLFKIAFNDRLGFAAALSLSLLAAMAFDARAPRAIAAFVIVVAAVLAIAAASFWRMQLIARRRSETPHRRRRRGAPRPRRCSSPPSARDRNARPRR